MRETDYKALSRGISRDMSPEAISRRLRIASELYDTAKLLGTARALGPIRSPDRPQVPPLGQGELLTKE